MLSALIAAAVALLTTLITSAAAMRTSRSRLAADVASARQKLEQDFAVEFAAERVAKALMADTDWRWRSFAVIKHHLGGFADDELRRLLVRSGAIRASTSGGEEVWGLLERNKESIGVQTVDGAIRQRMTPSGQTQQQQEG